MEMLQSSDNKVGTVLKVWYGGGKKLATVIAGYGYEVHLKSKEVIQVNERVGLIIKKALASGDMFVDIEIQGLSRMLASTMVSEVKQSIITAITEMKYDKAETEEEKRRREYSALSLEEKIELKKTTVTTMAWAKHCFGTRQHNLLGNQEKMAEFAKSYLTKKMLDKITMDMRTIHSGSS